MRHFVFLTFSDSENTTLLLLDRKKKTYLSDCLSLLYKKLLSENKIHRCHSYLCVFAAVVWSRQTTPSIPSSRESGLRYVTK